MTTVTHTTCYFDKNGFAILVKDATVDDLKYFLGKIDKILATEPEHHSRLRDDIQACQIRLVSIGYDDEAKTMALNAINEFNNIVEKRCGIRQSKPAIRTVESAKVNPDPIPSPKTTPTGDDKRLADIEKRLDGHERRLEDAESGLKAVKGAVGITVDSSGAIIPIANGQFDRNARVQEFLGYERNSDGTVSFDALAASPTAPPPQTEHPLRWGAGFAIGFFVVIVPYIITSIFWGWIAMSPFALGVAMFIALIVTLLPGKINQPRGWLRGKKETSK